MMKRSLQALIFGVGLIGSVATTSVAIAQPYPNKPIRIVVPNAPGGGTDVVARMIAESLQADLGQSILIENKPGAGGAVAAADVAKSPADGYTLLMAAAGFVSAPAVLPKAGYDPVKDFVGVRQLAIVPLIIVTRSDSKLENINDLLELARKDGDKVTFASFGNATPAHLAGEAINRLGKVKMTHIPYTGGMKALPDILAGNVTIGILDAVSTLPLVQQGKLKALAVTGPKRLPVLPNMPTLVESGIAFDAVGWHAVFVPAGTPTPIVNRLNTAFTKAMDQPKVIERIINGGSIPIEKGGTPSQWTAQYEKETKQWAEIAKAVNAKLE